MAASFDYVLLGGGLQSGLIALALLERHPGVQVAVVEREGHLGGNHTFCFHAADVPDCAAPWVAPLVAARWPGYEVHFPGLSRRIDLPYAAVTSQRLDEVVQARVRAAAGSALYLGQEAVTFGAREVRLADGQVLSGGTVIDARGLEPGAVPARAAFQKFVGVEVRLASGAAPALPVLMDARVPQGEGFHFLYVLPLAPDRLLVEDTLFADDARLDPAAMRAAALRHVESASTSVGEVLREESGVLPMPWAGSLPEVHEGPLVAGLRGGWFHPGTGYSFPLALRLAVLVAQSAPSPPPRRALEALCRAVGRQARFVHFLNRVLFRGVAPADRWRVMQRFYSLPEDLIARYYALDLTLADRTRILLRGNPWRELIRMSGSMEPLHDA